MACHLQIVLNTREPHVQTLYVELKINCIYCKYTTKIIIQLVLRIILMVYYTLYSVLRKRKLELFQVQKFVCILWSYIKIYYNMNRRANIKYHFKMTNKYISTISNLLFLFYCYLSAIFKKLGI